MKFTVHVDAIAGLLRELRNLENQSENDRRDTIESLLCLWSDELHRQCPLHGPI